MQRKRVDGRKVETAYHIAHEHDTEQEETVGEAREDECLLGGADRRGFVVPETDEQVARYAHQFPEDEHLEEVCGGDEPEHAETEQRKQAEETAFRAVFAHVADAVDVHHEADERDDNEHHYR